MLDVEVLGTFNYIIYLKSQEFRQMSSFMIMMVFSHNSEDTKPNSPANFFFISSTSYFNRQDQIQHFHSVNIIIQAQYNTHNPMKYFTKQAATW